jgi:hypothetical protein
MTVTVAPLPAVAAARPYCSTGEAAKAKDAEAAKAAASTVFTKLIFNLLGRLG